MQPPVTARGRGDASRTTSMSDVGRVARGSGAAPGAGCRGVEAGRGLQDACSGLGEWHWCMWGCWAHAQGPSSELLHEVTRSYFTK